jgi:RNA polymerase sigma-70 factor, ECF subfamily
MPRRRAYEPDDERLLIEAAKLDPRRFAELYENTFEPLYAYVMLRVRDRADAQDIVAEVYHQALANLARFEWRGVPFSAWLYRIASNAIADRGKRLAKEHSVDALEAVSPEDLEQVEQRAQVFRLVRELPPDQSRVMEMRFVEDRSIRDIAKELGRSEGAVKQLQFRGLQNLRDLMGEPDA